MQWSTLKRVAPLLKRPNELTDALIVRREARQDRNAGAHPAITTTISFEAAVERLSAHCGKELFEFLREPSLSSTEEKVWRRTEELAEVGPFPRTFSASRVLSRLCYMLCRVIRPSVVVETGVAYGATSAYILSSLERNGDGMLHSIDWSPWSLGAQPYVGAAVPDDLRRHWRLYRGSSTRLLPRVVRGAGSVDVFVSDSVHTYAGVLRELDVVTPRLSSPAAVLVDDVESSSAFSEWARRAECSAVVEAGHEHACGVAVLS